MCNQAEDLKVEDDESSWDIIFHSYLLDETPETFLEVVKYLDKYKKQSYHCYEDILDVLLDHRNDHLFTMLTMVIHNFRSEDFKLITEILYEVDFTEISALSMAYLIRGISKKVSQVSTTVLQELQAFVYSLPWPLDACVGIALLQIERQLNKLLVEQRHDFASSFPVGVVEGEESAEIENQRMLVMHELWNEDRISLMSDIWDLPYSVRSELGDATAIEDDLIDTLQREIEALPPGSDSMSEEYNIIIN